ncbi:MAG: hypothetical protein LBN39_10320 [Planctomycetaceae bacterium]|nr:hypothetical protein [Planctomycetaceae bacterium]
MRERAERYVETHPNKTFAKQIIENGMKSFASPGCLRREDNNVSFFRTAVSQFKAGGAVRAAAFLSKNFHDPSKLEIAANLAVPDFWRYRNPFGFLNCGSPTGQPDNFVYGTSSAVNKCVVPRTQREALNILTVQAESLFEPFVSLRETSSSANNSVVAPQRVLPLLV